MRNLRLVTLALVALVMSALLAACSGPGGGGLDPGSTEGTFALDVLVHGQGSVVIDDLNFECTNECTARIGEGVTVELRAQAQGETGFAGWQGACSGTGTCTLAMDSDKEVTAAFADNVLMLDMQGDGQGRVRVEPGDDCAGDCVRAYDSPVNVSLLVEPDDGSVAGGFGGACSDSDRDDFCLIQVQGRVDVTVNVSLVRFPLTVDVDGSGSVTGSGIDCPDDCSEEVRGGSQVTLTADPDEGWEFAGWSGACSGTQRTCSVEMDGAREVRAVFDRERFPLATTVVGDGSGTVTGDGISCPDDCNETYDSGESVTLTARAAAGSTFEGWSGDCAGTSSTCEVTIDSAKDVTATFDTAPLPTFTLNVSVNGDGSGTVTGDGISCPGDCNETYDEGESVTLTAAAAEGSTFEGWSGDCAGTSSTCEVTIDSAKDVTATFDTAAPPPPAEFTLDVAVNGDGTVTGDGINCEPECDGTYTDGTEVTLTANPGDDSTFDSWSGDCSGTDTTCNLEMDSNKDVAATFEPLPVVQHRLDVVVDGEGSGSVSGDGISCPEECDESYDEGTQVTLTAAPESDSELDSWDGCDSADNGSCTVTMTEPKQVTAAFSPLNATFTLALQFEGDGSGSVAIEPSDTGSCSDNCEVEYDEIQDVTLTAAEDDGSIFTSWSGDCSGDSSSCSLMMESDRNVTVQFDIDSSDDGEDDGSEGGDVQTSG